MQDIAYTWGAEAAQKGQVIPMGVPRQAMATPMPGLPLFPQAALSPIACHQWVGPDHTAVIS